MKIPIYCQSCYSLETTINVNRLVNCCYYREHCLYFVERLGRFSPDLRVLGSFLSKSPLTVENPSTNGFVTRNSVTHRYRDLNEGDKTTLHLDLERPTDAGVAGNPLAFLVVPLCLSLKL